METPPDAPTTNPDFSITIPTEYHLDDSNLTNPLEGKVTMKDGQDSSKGYSGKEKVDITIASMNSFKFTNGGEYNLVDNLGKVISAPITLDAIHNESAINAKLTKLGTKTESVDKLTFTYSIE